MQLWFHAICNHHTLIYKRKENDFYGRRFWADYQRILLVISFSGKFKTTEITILY